MGNHRGARRATSRSRSERPDGGYVGRRVAGREETPSTPQLPRSPEPYVAAREVAPEPVTATVEVPTSDFDHAATGSLRPAVPGKRRAARRVKQPALRGLPSIPV